MVQRTANGSVTHYLGKLYHQTPSSGPSVKHYSFNGQLVVRLWDNVSLRYRLSDHLGSATTELNYAGAKTADVRYEPWGTERWVQTALSVPYFFTSQRWDSELGLYDYNARYYDAKIGRFISADSIVPNPANPQSFNRYAYGFNNPVYYTDPNGHFPWPLVTLGLGLAIGGIIGGLFIPHILPWDPPMMFTHRVQQPITSSNMTGWLRSQMVTNAQATVVANIRDHWTSGDPIRMDAALQAFTSLVGTNATWDFKVDIEAANEFVAGTADVILGNRQLNFDAVANIHFGFVGRAAGFDAEFLTSSAGIAQIMRAMQTGDPNDWGAFNTTNWGDHPFATWSIEFGIYLYELYKDRLNELDDAAFASAWEAYIQEYGEPPDPPPGAVAP